jgi:HEAT repeat protein
MVKVDYTPEEVDSLLKQAGDLIPLMKKEEYQTRFKNAIEKRKENYREDNPFSKVEGTYDVDVEIDTTILEKVSYIQDKIHDWLEQAHPELKVVFNPTDRRGAYIVEEGGKLRRVKLSRLLEDAPPEVKKLVTQFPVRAQEQKTRVVITTDPLEVLRKSSTRSWAEESCERIGGNFDKGPFSDIANNNAIAYIFFGDNKEPSARVMMRWCESDNGKTDIGVEPIMYPRGRPYQFIIYDTISQILKKKGFGDYDECITPYIYEGYSDEMGRGHTKIRYKTMGIDNLIKYASDPNISRNVALTLLEGALPVRSALAENPGVCRHEEVVERILNKEDDGTVLYNLLTTCEPELNCEQANRLHRHTDRNVRSRIAKSKLPEECACDILNRLSHDENWYVREAVVRNTNIPKECACDILNELAHDEESIVREAVAKKTNIPKECACDILNELAHDEDWHVREVVAGNTNIPEDCACDILNELAHDKDSDVRSGVAENTNIPEECACDILKKLAHDDSGLVRVYVAGNTNIPEECACEILNELKDDENFEVRKGVAWNTNIPRECACDIFKKLAHDKNALVRMGVAGNSNIPRECACDIFMKLKDDENWYVRSGVAENTTIPKKCACDIFKKLAHDENASVREAVTYNELYQKLCR